MVESLAIKDGPVPRTVLISTREPYIWCVLAGCSYGLCYPPFNLTGFAFLAPALMMGLVSGATGRRSFLMALSFWTAAWGIPFYWVTMHRLPIAGMVSGVALMGLIFLMSAGSVGFAMTEHLPRGARVLTSALGILLIEALLLYGPVPMPWVLSGYSQAGSLWTGNLVRIFGIQGLGIVVYLIAAGVTWLATRRPKPIWWTGLFLAVFLSFAPSPLSQASFESLPTVSSGDSLALAVLLRQPGLSADSWADLDDPERNARILAGLNSLHPALDLVVLPETALIGDSLLEKTAQRAGIPILAGAILKKGDGYVNAALLAHAETGTDRYEKRILVPFAERTPLSGALPFLERMVVPAGGIRRYLAGTRQDAMSVSGIRIQPLICFESLFPGLVSPDADLLVVMTQDGWWRNRQARIQHFLYSRLLALEKGRPLIQVSVDGISGAVDADGRIVAVETGRNPVSLATTVPIFARTTFHQRIDDRLVAPVLAGAFLILILFRSISRTDPT